MSNELTKVVIDCATGTKTIVPLSAAEIAQRDQDAAAFAEAESKRKAEAERIAALKESAKAKLAALGLTEDEISAL